MNDIASGKRRGWVRGSRLASAEAQIKMLEKCNIRPIYNAEVHSFDDFTKALRVGDEVWVTSLARLAPRRRELREAINLIHSKDAVIVEAASERRSDRGAQATAMVLDAADELAGEARGLTPQQAQEFGAKGGKANAKLIKQRFRNRMSLTDARKLWTDPDLATLSNHRLLSRMPGWTQPSAYRHIGPRGLAKGRPRNDGTMSEKSRPGHVYFLQNGRRKLVKIGFSGDHTSRIGGIQSMNPDKLKLLATVPGSRRLEAELHKRFAKYRVQGEWFSVEGALAAYIARLTR